MEPGTKVRCLDDHFVDEKTNPFKASDLNLPESGKVYTVREVVKTQYGTGIRLHEIKNKQYYFDDIRGLEEPIFDANRFESQ